MKKKITGTSLKQHEDKETENVGKNRSLVDKVYKEIITTLSTPVRRNHISSSQN